ncbi:pyridoxamine 5'-phosphate oxidase family protein [Vreelandella nanhaiensis]|uniref:Pyridoxamine 5'-phosphate oxidase family protein n=1 Tax=Vreelandella nanhaiensis TaxID=1258546 RepID=A0A433KWP5_9GAMM|nr:pyridoxamine 5'-phosphate oxidase family protein [Halomonas nanhaiensis]RUR34141.1 pyridoxamine 5'-phosphate oxidase family protein [Halomonas nanhaiensis]
MTTLLTANVRDSIERSVLCWLATVDENGQPNVSPKEMFIAAGRDYIVIANIASPKSAKNIVANEKVSLSFIDIFVQKGFKITGCAVEIKPFEPEYPGWAEPFSVMAGDRFPISSVFVIKVTAVEPIIAPSYRLYPSETTEQAQIQAALNAYGVSREINND